MLKKSILSGFLLLLSFSIHAKSMVLKVMKNSSQFTVRIDEEFYPGKEITIVNNENKHDKAKAVIIECRTMSCLARLTDFNFQVKRGYNVKSIRKKKRWAAAISIDNALGRTWGGAFYYNFPRDPWMVGLKIRQIDNTTSNIKLSGQIFSLEAQRYVFHRKRLQLWGTSELGLMNVTMDFQKVNASEPNLSRTAYFMTIGGEGRYNLTDSWRLIAGLGFVANTLKDKYQGKTGEFNLKLKSVYTTAKLGVMYCF